MSLRDKPTRCAPWALAMLLLFLGAASCAGSVTDEPAPSAPPEPYAQFPDQQIVGDEEILYDYEEDEWGRPKKKGGQETAGEFLVAAGYVGMILASIVLPLLAL